MLLLITPVAPVMHMLKGLQCLHPKSAQQSTQSPKHTIYNELPKAKQILYILWGIYELHIKHTPNTLLHKLMNQWLIFGGYDLLTMEIIFIKN